MKKIVLVISALALSNIALAQSKNFEGFNIGLGVSSVNTNYKADTLGEGETWNFGGKQKVIPSVSLGYNLPITGQFLVGFEANIDLTNGVKSTQTYDDGLRALDIQQKNHWSFAIKPALALSDNTMAYAKLAAHKAKTSIVSSGDWNYTYTIAPSASHTLNQTGLGLGAGVEHNVNKNTFVRVEFEHVQYKSKDMESYTSGVSTSIKPSSTIGTIAVGYRF